MEETPSSAVDALASPALVQARLIRERQLAPVELVEAAIARIEAVDGPVGAFVTRTFDTALAEAEEAGRAVQDRLGPLGPFHGVPTAIKDENSTAGVATTYSSRAYADHIPDFDTNAVVRLRRSGLISLGKTNNPEFGTLPITESDLNGVCRTPWDLSRTSGGSSGGAAAAVAAGMVSIADAADGGGSIRMPAACCGLVGLKPARGRISFRPFGAPLEGFATFGVVTRTVADTAAALDVLAGYELGDPHWAPPPVRPFLEEVGQPAGRLRIALCTEPLWPVDVDPHCIEAVRRTGVALADLGHHVEEAGPAWGEKLHGLFKTVWHTGPSLEGVEDPALMEPHNRCFAEHAHAMSAPQYLAQIWELQSECRRILQFWRDVDVLVTPTLSRPPVPIGWVFQDGDPDLVLDRALEFAAFTPIANATGQPGISLPLHRTESDLPVGVQLLGRPAEEATLLRVAAQLESALPWPVLAPDLLSDSTHDPVHARAENA